VPLKAAFFDVGDTLVEHWAPGEVVGQKARAQVCAALGEKDWLDDFLKADIEPGWQTSLAQNLARLGSREQWFTYEPDRARQETNRWYEEWFRSRGIVTDGIDIDLLRSAMCVALDEISSPVAGAFDAVRWCAERGLHVILVTNTLSRGDVEALEDWRRFGLSEAIHGVVTSHSSGWRKPHPAIFERALEMAHANAGEAFHVGDNLIADVWGARQVGIKAIWRRSERARPPSDERGEPAARAARERVEECRHPSERLYLDDGAVRCGRCGELAGIEVTPDAIVDDLTQLQAAVSPWLARRVA
jgi:FMN phosphatase YigB (HAD superfamily)